MPKCLSFVAELFFFSKRPPVLCFEIMPGDVFFVLQLSVLQGHIALRQEPKTLFCTRQKVMAIALAAKRLEHLESGETLDVQIPTTSKFSIVRRLEKTLGNRYAVCTIT